MKLLKQAGVSRIIIERPHKKCRVTIYSARPGVVIGKKGADIEKYRAIVGKMTSSEVVLNIVEVRKPEIDSTLVADAIALCKLRCVWALRVLGSTVQVVWAALKLHVSNGIVRGEFLYTH